MSPSRTSVVSSRQSSVGLFVFMGLCVSLGLCLCREVMECLEFLAREALEPLLLLGLALWFDDLREDFSVEFLHELKSFKMKHITWSESRYVLLR